MSGLGMGTSTVVFSGGPHGETTALHLGLGPPGRENRSQAGRLRCELRFGNRDIRRKQRAGDAGLVPRSGEEVPQVLGETGMTQLAERPALAAAHTFPAQTDDAADLIQGSRQAVHKTEAQLDHLLLAVG